ncbi:MAG: ABC transporter transmembrane domain-containing protein [Hyphomicrobiaceae bacterium]
MGNVHENSKKRRSLKPLLALKPLILKYKGMLIVAAIALVVSALTMLAVPMAVRRMIDFGFTAPDGQLINQYFGMLIVLGCVLAVASASRSFCVNWLGERVVSDLRAKVFAHLTTLEPAFFEKSQSGELMSRLTADTTQIKAASGMALSQVLRNTIMLIGALVMMFITSAKLSVLLLVAIPAIVFPLMAYGRVVSRKSRIAQDELASSSAYAAENLAAVRTMQAFAHENSVTKRFASSVESSFEAARSRLFARAGLTALTMFLVTVSIVGVLWFGAASVVSGEMTGGRLGQFVLYALFAGGAMAELSEVYGELNQAAGAAERMAELLEVVPEIKSPQKPIAFGRAGHGKIAFENVSFCYPTRPDELALDNVTFDIKPGETVAVVGPSGAGKSTLFNLLLRFYDPSSGHVRVGDVDVSKADLLELRKSISIVPQDVALFADSVIENIRYGSPQARVEDVKAAAVAAQADAFIKDLPNGYETRLGERGVTLSGGQRQRLAIARAILKDAPILLLDEATSALDAENENAVQAALEKVMAGRTTLVIAHRLATVQNADRILVLDNGRIVEQGTHATLATADGLYGRLARLQFDLEAAE